MKVIVDRFEGEYAICEKEDLGFINLEIKKLPPDVKEGDVLIIEDDRIKIDENETKKRKDKIEALINDLWEY